jgi:hypothetical protein
MIDNRKWTRLLIDAMDDGLLDPRHVADLCLDYMSEEDVEDMCETNELKEFIDPEV